MNMIDKTRIAIRSVVANEKIYYVGVTLSSMALVYFIMTKGRLRAYEDIKRNMGVDFEKKHFSRVDWVDNKDRILDISFEEK